MSEPGQQAGSLPPRLTAIDEASGTCICKVHGASRLRVRIREGRTRYSCRLCDWAMPVGGRAPRQIDALDESPGESWRPVRGFEGHYEVSDFGRVRSLPRYVTDRRGRRRPVHERVLRQSDNGGGYQQVVLALAGRRHSITVHRLVLEAFVGPCPPGLEAWHNNGDQKNNHVTNLRWDTHAENNRDRFRHGTARRKRTGGRIDER